MDITSTAFGFQVLPFYSMMMLHYKIVRDMIPKPRIVSGGIYQIEWRLVNKLLIFLEINPLLLDCTFTIELWVIIQYFNRITDIGSL